MRKKQALLNIEYIVSSYANGISDCNYPILKEKEAIEYVKSQLYDIKVTHNGSVVEMEEGICKDLKFLSNEVLDEMIVEMCKELGIIDF